MEAANSVLIGHSGSIPHKVGWFPPLRAKAGSNQPCGRVRNPSRARCGEAIIRFQGTRRTHPVNLRLGFASDEYGYLIDMGLSTPNASAFRLDPQIKPECIWHGPTHRPGALLVDRHGPLVKVCSVDESWAHVTDRLSAFESMMTNSRISSLIGATGFCERAGPTAVDRSAAKSSNPGSR